MGREKSVESGQNGEYLFWGVINHYSVQKNINILLPFPSLALPFSRSMLGIPLPHWCFFSFILYKEWELRRIQEERKQKYFAHQAKLKVSE